MEIAIKKKSPSKQKLRAKRWIPKELYQTFKEELILLILKRFQKKKKKTTTKTKKQKTKTKTKQEM